MERSHDIDSLANYGLTLVEKECKTLKCAEIFFMENEQLTIEIEENSIKNSEIRSEDGVSIRVVGNNGSLGFAFTNNLKKSSIQKIIITSIKMMKAGTEDPDFKNFPSKYDNYPNVKGLFDKNIKNIQIEDSINYVRDLIKICSEDELAISQSADFSSNYSKEYIFNSNGVNVSEKTTLCSISSNVIVKDKAINETAFGFDWQCERTLKNIKTIEVVKNALASAKRNLNRKKIKKMKVPLILTPNGAIDFILKPIASAVNADTFQYKRSFLVDKREEIIGSNYLNIEDNALIDGAPGSSPFDGEGIPCRNKKIIENGKFLKTGLLHNSYTAGKEGIESTGNAIRKSYSSIPSIGISNFIMKPGEFSKEDIIASVKEGILLESTGDSPNITTGDFSGLILHGNLIKNGEVKDALNETMFGINLLDLFKNIEAISKEFKTYGPYRAPYVKIKEVQIIGAAP